LSSNNPKTDPQSEKGAPQGRPDVTRTFDTVAGELLGVAERSGAWVKDQVHSGFSEFVSRFLGLDQTKSPEPADPDKGIDR
jgi:hypothetical protein